MERALHAPADLIGCKSQVLGTEGDIVLDDRRHDLVAGILEDKATLPPGFAVGFEIGRSVLEDTLARNLDRALIGRKKAGDDGSKGRLA